MGLFNSPRKREGYSENLFRISPVAMLAAETAEETVDDPLWSQESEGEQEVKGEQEDQEEDQEELPPAPTKKRRTVKRKSKEERLAKCPHCLREFTNLKHHINQQHAQVRSWRANTSLTRPDIFSVEELHVWRVRLLLLPQD